MNLKRNGINMSNIWHPVLLAGGPERVCGLCHAVLPETDFETLGENALFQSSASG